MTPARIEPATFRFVAQHLNHCATAVPIVQCKCIIRASTCGVDSLCSLKVYGIHITIKCIETSETDRLTLSLWSGKSCVLSDCFHWEWMLCTPSTQSADSTVPIIANFYILYEQNFDTAIKICFILS